jgi:hypothetical protein
MEEKKMEKTCNGCNSSKDVAELRDMPPIPFAAHEAEVSRQERQIKRMWIALIVAIAMLFASNIGWLIYESQFVTVSYEQDGDGINNVNVGEQGDINNGAESENKAQEEQ